MTVPAATPKIMPKKATTTLVPLADVPRADMSSASFAPLYLRVSAEKSAQCTFWMISKGTEVLSQGMSKNHDVAKKTAAYALFQECFDDLEQDIYVNNNFDYGDVLNEVGINNLIPVRKMTEYRPDITTFLGNAFTKLISASIKPVKSTVTAPSKSDTKPSASAPKHESTLSPVIISSSGRPRGVHAYLLAATDASVSNGTVKDLDRVAGLGIFLADGRNSIVTMRGVPNAGTAEIWAIYHCLQMVSKSSRMHIRSDSHEAIMSIRDRREILAQPFKHLDAKIVALTAVDEALEERDVVISWVRGHDGYKLNEVAHELAYHGRVAHHFKDSASLYRSANKMLLKKVGWNNTEKKYEPGSYHRPQLYDEIDTTSVGGSVADSDVADLTVA